MLKRSKRSSLFDPNRKIIRSDSMTVDGKKDFESCSIKM